MVKEKSNVHTLFKSEQSYPTPKENDKNDNYKDKRLKDMSSSVQTRNYFANRKQSILENKKNVLLAITKNDINKVKELA